MLQKMANYSIPFYTYAYMPDNKNKTEYGESRRFQIPAEKITQCIYQNHDKSNTSHDISR